MSVFAQRKALIIGNSNFEKYSNITAYNDVSFVADAFKALDYSVRVRTDLDYLSMVAAIDSFKTTLRDGDIAVFYFSGYVKQEAGRNYLIPFNARLKHPNTRYFSIDVLQEALSRATESFLIIDAKTINCPPLQICKGKGDLAPPERLVKNQAVIMAITTARNVKTQKSYISPFTESFVDVVFSDMIDFNDLPEKISSMLKLVSGSEVSMIWKSNRVAPFSFYNPTIPYKYKFQKPIIKTFGTGGSYNF